MLAEKVRALATRQRARDLYDLAQLARRDLVLDEGLVERKPAHHGVPRDRPGTRPMASRASSPTIRTYGQPVAAPSAVRPPAGRSPVASGAARAPRPPAPTPPPGPSLSRVP